MNLKDRLENIRKKNNIIANNEDIFSSINIPDNDFVNNIVVEDILSKMLFLRKNIIYISDVYANKDSISGYFYSISKNIGAAVIDNIENSILNLNNKVNILSNTSVNSFVKILEYILYGYGAFVFGLNLASNENFIEKLKTIISLNYSNLTSQNIDILIGSSNSVVVNISKNSDGLFFVSEIKEIKYEDGIISLKDLYPSKNIVVDSESVIVEVDDSHEIPTELEDNPVSEEIIDDNIELEEEQFDENLEDVEDNIDSETLYESENIEEETSIENVNISVEKNSEEQKINKYKLLKEKIKNKRNV